MPNFEPLGIFKHSLRKRDPELPPEFLAACNTVHDANQHKIPDYYHEVPQGFTKALDDEELDALVWAKITSLPKPEPILPPPFPQLTTAEVTTHEQEYTSTTESLHQGA